MTEGRLLFEAQQAFVQRFRQAIGDPGGITVRRGMNRDGTSSGEPLETITRWQVGSVVAVLRDRIEELRDPGPPTGAAYPDAFLDGWEAALDELADDFRAADDDEREKRNA